MAEYILAKVATEVGKSFQMLADVLNQRGFDVMPKPTAKITEVMYQILLNEFLVEKTAVDTVKYSESNSVDKSTQPSSIKTGAKPFVSFYKHLEEIELNAPNQVAGNRDNNAEGVKGPKILRKIDITVVKSKKDIPERELSKSAKVIKGEIAKKWESIPNLIVFEKVKSAFKEREIITGVVKRYSESGVYIIDYHGLEIGINKRFLFSPRISIGMEISFKIIEIRSSNSIAASEIETSPDQILSLMDQGNIFWVELLKRSNNGFVVRLNNSYTAFLPVNQIFKTSYSEKLLKKMVPGMRFRCSVNRFNTFGIQVSRLGFIRKRDRRIAASRYNLGDKFTMKIADNLANFGLIVKNDKIKGLIKIQNIFDEFFSDEGNRKEIRSKFNSIFKQNVKLDCLISEVDLIENKIYFDFDLTIPSVDALVANFLKSLSTNEELSINLWSFWKNKLMNQLNRNSSTENNYFVQDDVYLFKGNIVDEQRDGYGSLIYSAILNHGFKTVDFKEYTGDFKSGFFHGAGKISYTNESVYEGTFMYGKREGIGKIFYENGNMYTGGWYKDKMHGYGEFYFSDGSVYKGNFRGGIKSGIGEHKMIDGSTYTGSYVGGYKDGHGKLVLGDGSYYIGVFKDDEIFGNADFYDVSGGLYRGGFSNGKRHGYGEYINNSGIRSIVLHDDGVKVSESTWHANDFFEGDLLPLNYSGRGTLNMEDGEVIDGIFCDGILIKGEKKFLNGEIASGEFNAKGNLVSGKITRNNQSWYGVFSDGEIELGEWSGLITIGEFYQLLPFNTEFKLVDNSKLNLEVEFKYSGSFQNNLPHGDGFLLLGVDKWKGKFDSGELTSGVHNGPSGLSFVDNKSVKHLPSQLLLEPDVNPSAYTLDCGEYQGTFKNFLYHGYGEYKFSSGEQYCGGWDSGKRHGVGEIANKNTVVKGGWSYGVLAGEIVVKNLIGDPWIMRITINSIGNHRGLFRDKSGDFIVFFTNAVLDYFSPLKTDIVKEHSNNNGEVSVVSTIDLKNTEINPQKLKGSWKDGWALDLHTTSSKPIYNDDGVIVSWDTIRPQIAEELYRLKYKFEKLRSDKIANTAAEFLNKIKKDWKFDLIIPIPPSDTNREFQPVYEIAVKLGHKIGVPVDISSLQKLKSTSQLKTIDDPTQRNEILNGAFTVRTNSIYGKTILLFDDLFRSGATLEAVCNVLMNKGRVKEVYVFTITKTRSKR
jgi:competence protein ComFC